MDILRAPCWAGAPRHACVAYTLSMLAAIFVVAVLVGIIESIMARLRMHVVPALIGLAGAVATFVLILTLVR